MKLHPDGINMSKLTTKDLRAVSLFHRIIKINGPAVIKPERTKRN